MKNAIRFLIAAFFAWSAPAFAADNTLIVTPGIGVTTRSKDIGAGLQLPYVGLSDGSGNAIGLVGAPAYIGFGTGVTLPAFASPPSVLLNTTPSLANGNGVVPTQGGNVLSATNGMYSNVLQGNAVLSTSNPIFITGTGTAGSAATNPITVQGISGGTNLPVILNAETTKIIGEVNQGTSPWVVSNGGTFAVQATLQASGSTAIGKVDPNTIATWGLMSGTTPGTAPTNTHIIGGIYNSSAPSPTTGQTLPLQQDSSGNLNVNVKSATGVAIGSATSGQTLSLIGCASTTAIPTATTAETWPVSCDPGNSIRVVNGASTYNTVAASQTAQALTGGSGGATGDYLSHCTIIPTSTSPGVVTILDNSTTIYSFPGGASSLSNLVPFTIPIGAQSTTGAWKVTTGVSLSVVCVGRFH